MSNSTFHILIATAGRRTLRNLLDSLKNELESNDAITIVFDGEGAKEQSEITSEWFECHKSTINIIEQTPYLGYWGHGIRNKYQGILNPECTFVMHADDDDTYVAGSFDKLRKLCINPNTLYIAKMFVVQQDRYIPANNNIAVGNIGTPNGIIPNAIAGKSTWENFCGGDGRYYTNLKNNVNEIVFLDEVVYTVRP